jgi:hypothetical protein
MPPQNGKRGRRGWHHVAGRRGKPRFGRSLTPPEPDFPGGRITRTKDDGEDWDRHSAPRIRLDIADFEPVQLCQERKRGLVARIGLN